MDRVLEVHRRPAPDAEAPYGWAYASIEVFIGGAAIAPLSAPTSPVTVTALLA